MISKDQIFDAIDEMIKKVDHFQISPQFNIEKDKRQFRIFSSLPNDTEILKTLAYLIAYSQNANSQLVDKVLQSGKLDLAFENFNINKVVLLNPCDIADNHWESIKGIRQQAKLFHIVTLARKLKSIGSFSYRIEKANIPTSIKTENDIQLFWKGFNSLLSDLKNNKIPFFQSTTSLLHFLLEIGFDCVKPDLVVMKVAKKIGIIENEEGDKNLRDVVKFIQEYSINRNIRPAVIDLYFLIEGKQLWAQSFVDIKFYDQPST